MSNMIKFAEACYDQNSRLELLIASRDKPDRIDLKTWNLTLDEYDNSIRVALYAKDNKISVEEAARILGVL
jgi:predicted HTH domain antitoxin